MRVNLPYVLKAKVVAHIFQGLLVFIAWTITFAILISPGGTDGRSKWYFTLVHSLVDPPGSGSKTSIC